VRSLRREIRKGVCVFSEEQVEVTSVFEEEYDWWWGGDPQDYYD
jgi:hypothetical protein